MITIHELLEDPRYKEWFLRKPVMPTVYRGKLPWRFYLQRETDGRWAKKDTTTYGEAFKLFKKYRDQMHDAAIVSRAVGFAPPNRMVRVRGKYMKNSAGEMVQVTKLVVWKPHIPQGETIHEWCPYCRRPTVFKYFSSHHAFPKDEPFDLSARRCMICGIREHGLPKIGAK